MNAPPVVTQVVCDADDGDGGLFLVTPARANPLTNTPHPPPRLLKIAVVGVARHGFPKLRASAPGAIDEPLMAGVQIGF